MIPFVLLCAGLNAHGQTKADASEKPGKCQKAYFDLSTGINNNGGLLSIGGDIHVKEDFSLHAGAGRSLFWGYKFYFGGKYYLNPCHRGWAFGAGLTFSSGKADYETEQFTITSPDLLEDVTLELLPQVNLFASAYKYWDMGKRNNRIYLQLGWSVPVTKDKFVQKAGNPLTVESARTMRFLSPGGLIIAVGFCFTGNN